MLFSLPTPGKDAFNTDLFWRSLLLHPGSKQDEDLTINDVNLSIEAKDSFDVLLSGVRAKAHAKRTVRCASCPFARVSLWSSPSTADLVRFGRMPFGCDGEICCVVFVFVFVV